MLEWHVAEGDFVNEGDTVVEVSTDKVDAEVPAPADGVITKLMAAVDDEVPVGAPLAEMEPGRGRRGEGSAAGPVAAGAACGRGRASIADPPTAPPAGGDGSGCRRDQRRRDGVRATPVARRVAAEQWRRPWLGRWVGARGEGDQGGRAGGRRRRRSGGCARPPPGRRSRCGGRRRCWPRRWTRAGRCPRRPRSGRSRSTRSTPSARRSTGCSRSAG